MFSPMTTNSLSRLCGFMFGSHGLELAALDEEVEKIGDSFKLDVFDPLHQLFDFAAFRFREQHLARAGERGIAYLDDTLLRDRRQKADLDRVAYVNVVGEASGQI